MNTVQIEINGTQSFMGKEIPVVRGGFGKDKKCVCDKTVAELHNMETKNVRARISDNIIRFTENVDFIDLKQRACQISTLELLSSLGYAKQSITQAEHIYLLSQRGYLKLVKIMDSDTAWETYNELLDKYFMMEEEQEKKLPMSYKEALQQLLVEIEEKEKLAAENAQKDQLIGELKPKADYTDLILQNDSVVAVTQISKDYGMSATMFNELLHELHIQYKVGGQWVLYSNYNYKSYTHSETVAYNEGKSTRMFTKWTQKGRLFLYNLLKENGVLPLIEQKDMQLTL